jgi:hypothetical protein
VPLIGNVRNSIAIFSYNGGLYFGITGDYNTSHDLDRLTTGIEHAMAELLERVTSSPGPVPSARV